MVQAIVCYCMSYLTSLDMLELYLIITVNLYIHHSLHIKKKVTKKNYLKILGAFIKQFVPYVWVQDDLILMYIRKCKLSLQRYAVSLLES